MRPAYDDNAFHEEERYENRAFREEERFDDKNFGEGRCENRFFQGRNFGESCSSLCWQLIPILFSSGGFRGPDYCGGPGFKPGPGLGPGPKPGLSPRRFCCTDVIHKPLCLTGFLCAELRLPPHCCVKRICAEILNTCCRNCCLVICYRIIVCYIDCCGRECECCRICREYCRDIPPWCCKPWVELVGIPEYELCGCCLKVRTCARIKCC